MSAAQGTPQNGTPGLLATRTWAIPLAVAWAVAFAAGSVGFAQRLTEGHQPANYGSFMTWGLWVAVYQYLIEMAAGAFILTAAIFVLRLKPLERLARVSLLLALVSLIAGIIMVWLDLGRMERFWRVIAGPDWSSVIAWVVVAYTAFLIVGAAALWFAMRRDLVERSGGAGFLAAVARVLTFGRTDVSEAALRRDMQVVRVLMIVGLVPAIGFSGGEGALFGVVGARPYWNSSILPIAFLASSLVTAGAALTVFGAFFWPERSRRQREMVIFMGRLTMISLAALLLLEFADYSVGMYASIPAQRDAYDEILSGDYWWSFWLVHLLGGAAIPFVLLAIRGKSPSWLGIAALLVAAGMLSVRLNAVIPGQILPQLEGLDTAFVSDRLAFDYAPSVMEWLVSLFVASIAVLLFYVGYRLLPIGGQAIEATPGPGTPQPEIAPAARFKGGD